MIVQAHVIGLGKRCFHGVVACRDILRVPVGDRRAGRHLQIFAGHGQLRVVQDLSGLFFLGIDLSGPPRDGDPTARNHPSTILCLSCDSGMNERGKGNCEDGAVNETHGEILCVCSEHGLEIRGRSCVAIRQSTLRQRCRCSIGCRPFAHAESMITV